MLGNTLKRKKVDHSMTDEEELSDQEHTNLILVLLSDPCFGQPDPKRVRRYRKERGRGVCTLHISASVSCCMPTRKANGPRRTTDKKKKKTEREKKEKGFLFSFLCVHH